MGRTNSADVRLRALEREAAADRSLFETFLSRLKETTSQETMQRPDARIISRADIPVEPSFPRKKLLLAGAGAIALLMGLGAALLLENLDPGFRSAEQLEEALDVSGLGLIPLLGGMRSTRTTAEAQVIEKPTSSFAESLRTLYTAILLSNVERPPKTVLVTSSVPREGKSTISLAMARLMAKSGKRVLLIDADLRRPRVAKSLKLGQEPGLVDVLAGVIGWEEALQTDEKTDLRVLTPGKDAVSPPDLFSSSNMRALLAELSDRFELIVIDSPPVLAVSEARVLAGLVDTTLFVIRWAGTPREVVGLGIKQMREAGGSVAGAVLSMVNVRQHARYGYGDSWYYYTSRYYSGGA